MAARGTGGAGGTITAAKAKRLRKQVTDMQAKLARKRPPGGGLFTPTRKRGKKGVFDKFCKWCKRAERTTAMHSHNSGGCRHKL